MIPSSTFQGSASEPIWHMWWAKRCIAHRKERGITKGVHSSPFFSDIYGLMQTLHRVGEMTFEFGETGPQSGEDQEVKKVTKSRVLE